MSVVIGIAGPSCSGKTMLAKALATKLPDTDILPVDAYYRDLSHMPSQQRAASNFDEPAAIEHELLIDHVRALRHGLPVDRPIYDFATHTRTNRTQPVAPTDLILVEGLFALYWPELRALFDAAIFVNAPHPECLTRRIQRDMRERARTQESVITQYNQTVRPMYDQWCKPTQQYADLILNGCNRPQDLLQKAINLLQKKSYEAPR